MNNHQIAAAGLLFVCAAGTLQAQPRMDVAASSSRLEVTNVLRPRIAMATNGTFAVAYEAQVEDANQDRQWQIFLKLHDAGGADIGPQHRILPESYCSTFDAWSADYVDNADMAFRPDGLLIMAMSHSGWFSLGGVDDVWETETTLAVFGTDGQQIDLNDSGGCMQHKLNFVGADDVEHPRITTASDGSFLVIQDGYFEDDDSFGEALWRNSALRIFTPDGSEAVEQLVVHDDPASTEASHWRPDVVMAGNVIFIVWQECPIIDGHGNASECNVAGQFLAVSDGSLQALGGNVRINAGGPAGTFNVWPSASMNGAGQSIVVWVDNRSGFAYEVYAQRFGPDGQAIGGNIQVSEGDGEPYNRPEVAVFDDGRFAVVWEDSSSVGFRARVRYFDAAGRAMTDPTVLLSTAGRESRSPDIDAAGNWLGMVWKEVDGDLLYVQTARREIGTITGVASEASVDALSLNSYPNPFDDDAVLEYVVDTPGHTSIVVYDVLGRKVARLASGHRSAGTYTVSLDGASLTPGNYVIRMTHGERRTQTMIVKGR